MYFTQYLMPNGRQIETEIDMDTETEEIAAILAEQGIRFSNEILTTGMVALYAERYDGEEDNQIIELTPNGEGVPLAVKRLVENANNRWRNA